MANLDSMIDNSIRPFHYYKEDQPLRAACFHPFGDVYAIGSNSRTLSLYSYPTQDQLKHFTPDIPVQEPELIFTFLKRHRGSIYCVAFNSEGNLLATGSNDQTVHITKYNPQTQLPENTENLLTMHSGTVRDVCFTPTNLISAGAGDNGIYITDIQKFKTVQKFKGHESTVMSLNCWNDECSMFVSGSLDGTIRLWDLRLKTCVSTFGTNSESRQDKSKMGVPVGVVRVENSGKLLVSGHKNGQCMLYELRGGRIIQSFKPHDDEIRSVNFSPKSYYLVTTGYDGKVKLFDIQGNLGGKLPGVEVCRMNDKIVQTAWHPTEYNFVSTCAEGSFCLWVLPRSTTTTMASSITARHNTMMDRTNLGGHDSSYQSTTNTDFNNLTYNSPNENLRAFI